MTGDTLEALQAEARRVAFDLGADRERLRRIARRLEALPVEATAEQPWRTTGGPATLEGWLARSLDDALADLLLVVRTLRRDTGMTRGSHREAARARVRKGALLRAAGPPALVLGPESLRSRCGGPSLDRLIL